MRRGPAFRVLQRRSVAKPNQSEELIELAVAVDRQRLPAQRVERDRVLGDDRGEENAHAAILTSSGTAVATASQVQTAHCDNIGALG